MDVIYSGILINTKHMVWYNIDGQKINSYFPNPLTIINNVLSIIFNSII